MLCKRAMPYVGSYVNHNNCALITLSEAEGNVYKIVELRLFYPIGGWIPVIPCGKLIEIEFN